jgi:serine protease Do
MSNRLRAGLILIIIVVLITLGLNRSNLKLPENIKWPNLPSSGQITTTPERRVVVDEENAVIQAVEKSSPSVVAIGVNQRIINPFDPFSQPSSRQSTIGTGFVASDKGIIVTNKHVVSDSTIKYSVITKDNKKLEVTKIYRDPNLDLAIIQVNSTDLTPLELGDSSKLKVGQTAIAIGNALGRFENSVTTGVVSGLGRAVSAGDPFSGETERLDNLIQTDAAINPGNSGGPLLNSAGQVVGVNVATTEGAQNIGFAIPINSVRALIQDFTTNGGNVQRAYLGVRYRLVSRDIALLNQVPQGAYIQEIINNSPADKAGIQAGDIITKIDGQPVDTETKISEVIQKKKVGDSVTVEVWSDGKTKTVSTILAESPNQ